MTVDKQFSQITEEEEQVYDRQIRLWGVDAQNRIKNANILAIGVTPLLCEIVKNLVLAGVNRISLVDNAMVSQEDIDTNFLIDRNSIGANRAKSAEANTRELNPRVRVDTHKDWPQELGSSGDALSIAEFDLVVCGASFIDCSVSPQSTADIKTQHNDWMKISEACRAHRRPLVAVDSFGWHGLAFIDLLEEHRYVTEQLLPRQSTAGDSAPSSSSNPGVSASASSDRVVMEAVKQFRPFSHFALLNSIDDNQSMKTTAIDWKSRRTPKLQFLSLVLQQFASFNRRYATEKDSDALIDLWRQFAMKSGLNVDLLSISDFDECLGAGKVPVNSVLGGLVTQEIIKAISKKNEPVGNFILFNGISCSAESTYNK